MIAAWLVATALAQDCAKLAPPPDHLAVAWVSPVRRSARRGTWLPVVPAADLRAFVKAQSPSPGRLLQALGVRKRAKDPKRRYKVTIFDLTAADLCRPVEGTEEGYVVDGVGACGRLDHATSTYSGCGYTTDQADGKRRFDLYRVQWKTAAARGFCVLPLERYLSDSAQ